MCNQETHGVHSRVWIEKWRGCCMACRVEQQFISVFVDVGGDDDVDGMWISGERSRIGDRCGTAGRRRSTCCQTDRRSPSTEPHDARAAAFRRGGVGQPNSQRIKPIIWRIVLSAANKSSATRHHYSLTSYTSRWPSRTVKFLAYRPTIVSEMAYYVSTGT